MAYFPLFVELKEKRCLVIGGGKIAYQKVKGLLPFEVKILVVAKEIDKAFLVYEKEIQMVCRSFEMEDLKGMDLVVCATSDSLLNRDVARWCREHHVFVNVVDSKEECSFLFPSTIREGDLTVGISTAGKSPTVARYLKARFEEQIPNGMGQRLERLGLYREYVKQVVDSLSLRKRILVKMVELDLENEGVLTRDMVDQLIESEKSHE